MSAFRTVLPLLKESLLFVVGRSRSEIDFRVGKGRPGNWLLVMGGLLVIVTMQFQRLTLMLILLPMLMVYLYEPFFRGRLIGDSAVAVLPYRAYRMLAGAASEHYRRVARDSIIILAAILIWFFVPMILEFVRDLRSGGEPDIYSFKLWGSLVLVFALGSFWVVLVAFAAPACLMLASGIRPVYSLLAGLILIYGSVVAMNLICHPWEAAEENFARDDLGALPATFRMESRPMAEWILSPFYFLEVGRGTFTSGSGRWRWWLAMLTLVPLFASLSGQATVHLLFRRRLLE